ncbi:MAG: DNA polymerase I [Leptospirales bacterium]|nr:DNA polymerase I [Leptospirales bacterium]
MTNKKTLYVIDGHALCYRAYFALIKNPLINSSGQNVSAIYGFARMLFKLIDERKPDCLAVAFDPPKRSFRFEMYKEYKANRAKMPEDLKTQIDEIKNMVDALGLKRLEHPDVEGDDILGTIASKYSSPELSVYLVTGDKDAYQLLEDNVYIYAPKKGISEYEIYDKDTIKDKIGLSPAQVVDYMALTGDTTDNIPGIRGIGEKTALKLITEYGSLDNLYEHTGELKGRQKELIIQDKDNAYLSKELVTIRRDADIEFDISEADCSSVFSEEARNYFINIEMPGIARDYFKDMPQTTKEQAGDISTAKKNYVLLKTETEITAMINEIRAAGEVSVDTETTSLFPMEADLVGLSFSIKEHEGWYVPLISKGLFNTDYFDSEKSLAALKPLLEDPAVKKIGQNIKYDSIVLKQNGITLRGISFDTLIASYLLAPNERRHSMDDIAEKYLNYKTISFKELTGTGKNAVPISEIPLDKLSDYAIEDADITYRLYKIFKPKLESENLSELFYNVEMKMVNVLAAMERQGVKIDLPYFASLKQENSAMLAETGKNIYAEAGTSFNINSTKELSAILFDKLGLKPQKKTKTGLSTDISVLEQLKGHHNIIDHLIMYRTLNKLKGTYIDALPELVNQNTGRIHTSYNQTVAATGRLSSSDPNLQNIPIRDEMGKKIRKGFIPEKGFTMLSADYSQIELRLAAHLSGDGNMIRAFTGGADIHSMTAASVFGVDVSQVTQEMRRQAKIINFATIYGVSPYGLSQQAQIDIKEAARFIKAYFEVYPAFNDYMQTTIEFARENGYVRTILGRKREILEIDSKTSFRRESAERIAINTPIQGSSADLIKLAMIRIHDEFESKKLRSKMIMQVHDELVFEVHDEEKDEVASLVKTCMENALELSVPIVVDLGWGKNWEEAH